MNKLLEKLIKIDKVKLSQEDFIFLDLKSQYKVNLFGGKTNNSCNNIRCHGNDGLKSNDDNNTCTNDTCNDTDNMNNDGCTNRVCS